MKKNKVFFEVATSLDGFIAPAGMDRAHADDPDSLCYNPRHVRQTRKNLAGSLTKFSSIRLWTPDRHIDSNDERDA